MDPRFASIRKDPRFARFPKGKGKVELDARFGSVLSDPKFTRHAPVDKRGRVAAPGRRVALRRLLGSPAHIPSLFAARARTYDDFIVCRTRQLRARR